MSAWLPHEPVVEQDIDVYLKDQKYQIWGGARRNYDLNNELGGKAIKIRVELLSNVVEYGNTVGRFTIEQ